MINGRGKKADGYSLSDDAKSILKERVRLSGENMERHLSVMCNDVDTLKTVSLAIPTNQPPPDHPLTKVSEERRTQPIALEIEGGP